MKYLFWFLIGCICIGIPFFISYNQHDMWNSVISGTIGGAIFLILFYFYSVRKLSSLKWNIVVASLFTFYISAFAALTVTSYRMSTFQHDNLMKIRTYIIAGVIVQDEIYRRTLPTLRNFYDQPKEKKKSFAEVFNNLYGNKIRNGIFEFESLESPGGTYVTYQGDSTVKLIACVDTISKGIRSDFKNINGRIGKIQFTATMSKHGVTYERNN